MGSLSGAHLVSFFFYILKCQKQYKPFIHDLFMNEESACLKSACLFLVVQSSTHENGTDCVDYLLIHCETSLVELL